jgi:hypothetical protein
MAVATMEAGEAIAYPKFYSSKLLYVLQGRLAYPEISIIF